MNFKKNDMKTFSTFTTGIILSATLMTACSKEDKMNVTPAQASHRASSAAERLPVGPPSRLAAGACRPEAQWRRRGAE